MSSDRPPVATFKSPLYVAWEITHRCNAHCLHCYSDSGPEAETRGDLSTEEAISVIDQLAEAGLLVLAFSGGEPMLRRDWRILVEHALSCGLTVNIGTNGSCITKQNADYLQALGIHSVTVSLDSEKAEVHDYFRQYKGLHQRAIKAIQRLAERDVRVVVGFTPTRINWKDGPQVVDLARSLGAAAVNLSEYVPAGRGECDLALKPEELRMVLQQWIEMRTRYAKELEVIWHDCRVGLLVSEDEKRNYVGCGAGRLVGRICPDGTVTPCVFLPAPIGSFRKDSFLDMWRRSHLMWQFRRRVGEISGNCGVCEHLETCGGCRAVAYAYSGGDALAGDPHCWLKSIEDAEMKQLPQGESLPI